MSEGPRSSQATDQKVWGSNPYGRALGKESAVDCVVIQIVIFGLSVTPLT